MIKLPLSWIVEQCFKRDLEEVRKVENELDADHSEMRRPTLKIERWRERKLECDRLEKLEFKEEEKDSLDRQRLGIEVEILILILKKLIK